MKSASFDQSVHSLAVLRLRVWKISGMMNMKSHGGAIAGGPLYCTEFELLDLYQQIASELHQSGNCSAKATTRTVMDGSRELVVPQGGALI